MSKVDTILRWMLTLLGVYDWIFNQHTGASQAIAWWIPLLFEAGYKGAKWLDTRNDPKTSSTPGMPRMPTPDQLGIPPTLPDGRPNPLYQFFQSGIVPFSGDPTRVDTTGSSTTKTDSTTTSKGTSKTFPTYLPQAQGTVDMIPDFLNRRLLTGGKVSPAEKAGVYGEISNNANLAEKGLINQLASRGFMGSPVEAGAREGLMRGVLGATSKYETEIPGIEQQRGADDLGLVSNILQGLYKGGQTDMNNTSRTTGVSDTSSSSSSLTTGPPGFQVPPGLFTPGQNPPGPDYMGDISQLIMMLWGMGAFDKKTSTPTRRV